MSNSKYVLFYEIDGKTIVVCCSANYIYMKRKKKVYDKTFGKIGQIKKLQKS